MIEYWPLYEDGLCLGDVEGLHVLNPHGRIPGYSECGGIEWGSEDDFGVFGVAQGDVPDDYYESGGEVCDGSHSEGADAEYSGGDGAGEHQSTFDWQHAKDTIWF